MRSLVVLGSLLSAAVMVGCGSSTIIGGGGSGNTGNTGNTGGLGGTGNTGNTGGSGASGGEGAAGGASLCGNAAIDEGEDCDGALTGGVTCLTLGFDGGDLGCDANCVFDTSGCSLETCGNGALDVGEECEGLDLGGVDCIDLGFNAGELACNANCTFDTSACQVGECVTSFDCPSGGDCTTPVCNGGLCGLDPLPAGAACGSASAGDCGAADTCDGAGSCLSNDAPDGTACTGCAEGLCSCSGGQCGACQSPASQNHFTTARSVESFTLTGDFRLYREAPQSQQNGPTRFGSQVFGTDGNRQAPYPGAHNEASSATTHDFVLPSTLTFSSWNVDEGSGYDNKTIELSVDGGASWTVLVDCSTGVNPQPFCTQVNTRPADAWDAIALDTSAFAGATGRVRFSYNTGDGCCGFEQGWFIDATNFATECACTGDAACAGYGSACGAGVCSPTGACGLAPVAEGTACGSATSSQCDGADACDGLGYCDENEAPTGLTLCTDCPSGSCNTCQEGVCADCVGGFETNDFSNNPGWTVEAISGTSGWGIYNSAPQNQNGSPAVPLSFGPSFGTDGNRVAPYPGAHNEHSRVTTSPVIFGGAITFDSWNVDEGSGVDTKLIELSVDGGATWTVLVDCSAGFNPQPFCDFRDDSRAGNDWDAITLDTSAFAGQQGVLRLTYNTLDACCSFERGWFIDNLSFRNACLDGPFP
jgi:hypothetical protein